MAIDAVASPNLLNLSYPLGNASSVFSLLVSPFSVPPLYRHRDVTSWADVVGLEVEVTGNVDLEYALSFAGTYGGSDAMIK